MSIAQVHDCRKKKFQKHVTRFDKRLWYREACFGKDSESYCIAN